MPSIRSRWILACSAIAMSQVTMAFFLPLAGCAGVPIPGLDDVLNMNGNTNGNTNSNTNDNSSPSASYELDVFATNTGGATGIALRPGDGALFAVNTDGLFGPIEQGTDLGMMMPFGATNLATPQLFVQETSSLVLAISNDGEFWIGSQCCFTLAVVPAAGGDAEPFLSLGTGVNPSNIKPETMAIVPAGFAGAQMMPGDLLVGQETTFSRLSAIDVSGNRDVVNVDNPLLADGDDTNDLNRFAHHLAFGLDGNLYSSRGTPGLTISGLQRIATDGTPTLLPGTLGVSANTFVGLANGDLLLRGTRQTGPTTQRRGILFYNAAEEMIDVVLEIAGADLSEDDELIIAPDGNTIYLSLPNRNEIVTVRKIED